MRRQIQGGRPAGMGCRALELSGEVLRFPGASDFRLQGFRVFCLGVQAKVSGQGFRISTRRSGLQGSFANHGSPVHLSAGCFRVKWRTVVLRSTRLEFSESVLHFFIQPCFRYAQFQLMNIQISCGSSGDLSDPHVI